MNVFFQMTRQMLFLTVVACIMSLLVSQVVSHPGLNPYPNPLTKEARKVSFLSYILTLSRVYLPFRWSGINMLCNITVSTMWQLFIRHFITFATQ